MEIWKDIKDYPGYQVSNEGRIKSFKQSKEGKILKPKISAGYAGVDFRKDGRSHYGLVHRVVLSTFAPVENWEVLTVNHIDGNCLNNNLENLEWMTQSENTAYSRRVLQTGNRIRRVHIITLRGEEKFYESATEAAKQLGVSKTAISNWANKKRSYEGKFRLVEYV